MKRYGVKLIAPLLGYTGYDEFARNFLMAMHTVGINLTVKILRDTKDNFNPNKVMELAKKLENKRINYNTVIIVYTPNVFPTCAEPDKKNIGYFFWEVKGVDKRWVFYCNTLDEIWLPTESLKKQFKKAGVFRPIKVVPCAIDSPISKGIKPLRNNKKVFKFYAIFNWTPRKNPEALIETFCKTFAGYGDVALLLKTYGNNFSFPEQERIKELIRKSIRKSKVKNPPHIWLIPREMSEQEILRIHKTCDCYVSAHRGEGWGYPQAQALAFGNPVISTDFGGIHEYLYFKDGLYGVPYKLTNVRNMPWIPWYHFDQKWAEINRTDLGFLMEMAYLKMLVKPHGNKFDYKFVGNIIKKLL